MGNLLLEEAGILFAPVEQCDGLVVYVVVLAEDRVVILHKHELRRLKEWLERLLE